MSWVWFLATGGFFQPLLYLLHNNQCISLLHTHTHVSTLRQSTTRYTTLPEMTLRHWYWSYLRLTRGVHVRSDDDGRRSDGVWRRRKGGDDGGGCYLLSGGDETYPTCACVCVCVCVCVWRDELGGSMRWEGSICRVRRVKVYMYIARLVTEADIDTHTMHTTLYHITHSQHTFHFRHETMARHGDITPSLSHTHTIKIQQFLSYTSRLDQTKCLQTFLVYRRLKPWD